MPKIVNKEERRNHIAMKAFEIFVEQGIEGTTIQQIAASSGIAKGSVYQYFETKDDIIQHITKLMWQEAEQAISRAMGELDDEGRIFSAIIEEITGFWGDDIDTLKRMTIIYMEIFVLNLRGKLPGTGDFLKQMLEMQRKMVREVITRGINNGVFRRDCNADSASVIFCGSLDGIAIHYIYDPGRFDLKSEMENFLKMFFASIITPRGKRRLTKEKGV